MDLVSPGLCDRDGLGLFLARCVDSFNVLVIQFLTGSLVLFSIFDISPAK